MPETASSLFCSKWCLRGAALAQPKGARKDRGNQGTGVASHGPVRFERFLLPPAGGPDENFVG